MISEMATLKTTLIIAVIFIGDLHFISAQQIFRKSGDNYDAKVSIHRSRDNLPAYAIPAAPRGPWRQGDRITKQEIIQNLAKELLSRRKTEDEKREERSQTNAEKLQEYTLMQVKLQQLQKEKELRANWNPQPQQPRAFNGQPPQQPSGAYLLPPRRPRNPAYTREFIPRKRRQMRFRKDIEQ